VNELWRQMSLAFQANFNDLPDLDSTIHLFVRMGLALLLGGALGWQREHVGKAAGLRTHMLVCLGAALFVGVPILAGMNKDGVSRIIQGLTTGIGFVGAGAIVKMDSPSRIHGLTTAAGIWLTAAIGVAVGMGRGLTAAVATAIAFLILWLIPGEQHPLTTSEDAPKPNEGPKK
jgi:putative Mg2+ transporter-C (MgtC) family protein